MSASFRGVNFRAASVFWLTWSVFIMVTQVAEMRGSVQMAVSKPWCVLSPRSRSAGTLSLTFVWPAICFIETRPMPFLWAASRARLIGSSLASQGLNASMITSMKPAFGGRLDLLGLEAIVSGKADELAPCRSS